MSLLVEQKTKIKFGGKFLAVLDVFTPKTNHVFTGICPGVSNLNHTEIIQVGNISPVRPSRKWTQDRVIEPLWMHREPAVVHKHACRHRPHTETSRPHTDVCTRVKYIAISCHNKAGQSLTRKQQFCGYEEDCDCVLVFIQFTGC